MKVRPAASVARGTRCPNTTRDSNVTHSRPLRAALRSVRTWTPSSAASASRDHSRAGSSPGRQDPSGKRWSARRLRSLPSWASRRTPIECGTLDAGRLRLGSSTERGVARPRRRRNVVRVSWVTESRPSRAALRRVRTCTPIKMARTPRGRGFWSFRYATSARHSRRVSGVTARPQCHRRTGHSKANGQTVLQSANLDGRPVVSNPRSAAYFGDATAKLARFFGKVARPAGFEPATLG